MKHGCLACSPFLGDEVESLVPSVTAYFKIGETEAQESHDKSNNNSQHRKHFILSYLQMSREGAP